MLDLSRGQPVEGDDEEASAKISRGTSEARVESAVIGIKRVGGALDARLHRRAKNQC